MKHKKITIEDRLIISMDVSTKKEVFELCKKISNKVTTVKIGLELIYSQGLSVIETVKGFGYKVMLDSKLLDIPNTVSGACKAIAGLQPSAITIHTLGGRDMISSAKSALKEYSDRMGVYPPLLMGVSVLTSLDDHDLEMMGFGKKHMDVVVSLASMGVSEGLDGVICSPREVKVLRERMGSDFLIATPGIRLQEDEIGDQKRVATPQKALKDGADFLIVGRSIIGKSNVSETIDLYLNILGGKFLDAKSN